MNINPILNCDSYKTSHFLQYPSNSEIVSSYIEARVDREEQLLFFGLQAFLKEYLSQKITLDDIQEAKEIILAHGLYFNQDGWLRILHKHGGRLPLAVRALPEGTIVPGSVPMVQLNNTDAELPWLTSYFETALLRAVWYPTTVASLSREIRKTIQFWLKETSNNEDVEFKLVDFGARGASSLETAAIGGAAHMLSFQSTDNIAAIVWLRKHYGANMPGFSIPAAEHSTITAWTKERETEAYENMLKKFGSGAVAVVSDSYDIFNAVRNIWGERLRDQVLQMDGALVIRPDSGIPHEVVVECLKIMDEKFGSVLNSKGYRVLTDKVRLIQGDGVNNKSIHRILQQASLAGYSAENVTFGMGGALLQKMDRDTYKFAQKASAIRVAGKWVDVYKDPITDSGKRSKKGVQAVVIDSSDGLPVSKRKSLVKHPEKDIMVEVFRNGEILVEESFQKIRNRSLGD